MLVKDLYGFSLVKILILSLASFMQEGVCHELRVLAGVNRLARATFSFAPSAKAEMPSVAPESAKLINACDKYFLP